MQTKVILSVAIATLLLQVQANVQPVPNAIGNPNQAVENQVIEDVDNIVPINFKKKSEKKNKAFIQKIKKGASLFSDTGAYVYNDDTEEFVPVDGSSKKSKKEKEEKEKDEEDEDKGKKEEKEEKEEDEEDEDKGKKKKKKENKVKAQELSSAAPASAAISAAPSVKPSVSTGISMSFPTPSNSANIPKFGVGSAKNPSSVRPTGGARVASPVSGGNTIRASIGVAAGVIGVAVYSLL